MGLNLKVARRKNIDWLVRVPYKTQTALGKALDNALTQRILSDIQHDKRGVSTSEARNIERILVIPIGWMDRANWGVEGWALIKQYRELGEKERAVADRLCAFVLERLSSVALNSD